MAKLTRRGALGALGAMVGSSATAGCGLGGDLSAKLPDPDPSTPLTIDVHSHVFNLSDTQFRDFVKHAHPDQAAIVDMLGDLGTLAPPADKELAALGGAGLSLPTLSLPSAPDLGERQYQEARRSMRAAQKRLQDSDNPRKKRSAAKIGARLDGLQPTYHEYKKDRREQRKARLHVALQQRSMARAMSPTATPFAPPAMSGPCGGASTSEDISFDGLFDFVMRNFHYRYVNAHDYITEYSASPVRKVDIMITQIIDYDWPLGDERTHSSLHDQVRVMERIMKLTNGRVLNFAPFCPFKQVAHNRGYRNEDGSAVDNPLAIVQDAVLNRGHIGVKIYPPMGFMPYDNEGLQRRDPDYYWGRTPVRKPLLDASLGRELDDALDALYSWCLANEVPVMAHTSPGNAADCRYLTDIMVPESWAGVVRRYPGLRVNFAHFGHTDIVANSGHNAGVLMSYMTEGRDSAGRHLYADSAYFAEVLTERPQVEGQLRTLLRNSVHKGNAALSHRLMYGSDWEMVIMEGGTTAYLDLFGDILGDLSQDGTISPRHDLADRFFGLNAAAYLGLHKGEANRWRLERFFGSRTLPWMVKLDKTGDTPRV
jgi:predicted TIM-barrel fold metal-dependent hydrolase